MNKFISLLLLGVYITYCTSTLMEEMAALDKELEKKHHESSADSLNKKVADASKSLKDLSTEELITELQKELSHADSKADYHRTKFDDILDRSSKKETENELYERGISRMFDEMSNEAEACDDSRNDCKSLLNYCESNKIQMEKRCKRTCGWCPRECKDQTAQCENFGQLGYCDHPEEKQKQRVMRMCPKTCGVCTQPAPPKCSKSTYGCCWDKETMKSNKEGGECPECKDLYRYVCKNFKDDCIRPNTAGIFMNRNCPETCGRCSGGNGKCIDAVTKGIFCSVWKDQLNWCQDNKEMMRHFCPKTCNYC